MAKGKGTDIDKAMAKLVKKVQLMRTQHAAALERKVAKLRAEKLPWLKQSKEP